MADCQVLQVQEMQLGRRCHMLVTALIMTTVLQCLTPLVQYQPVGKGKEIMNIYSACLASIFFLLKIGFTSSYIRIISTG